MTEGDRIFQRFAPFIREYMYRHGWDRLRPVQMAAARVLFDSEDDLLLSASTASGKTEAVFFPILTDLCQDPPATESIAVLYIAPLKSLINDQFQRMEELLSESAIPVTHWHGDAPAAAKEQLLRHPSGILQITPESLESMLMRRGAGELVRLFSGLRYVVLDEIHTLIGSDRGDQVLCQLGRLSRVLGTSPRRIGLSATIGDLAAAGAWLSAGSGHAVQTPAFPQEKLHWRLGFSHFYIPGGAGQSPTSRQQGAQIDAGYEYLYDAVRDKRALVFSNSREETEYVTATLRQIARKRHEADIFYIHHGNLSAALREDAESRMKDDSARAVTCATVTMELGIDIGRLERVVQMDAPTSVSGFLQRLGRSGRRGDPPEMIEIFREEMPLPGAPLPQLIPWGLLRAIAIVELYAGERFIEPPRKKRLPFSLLFHQTLSILSSSGALKPRELAERVLPLPPFASVSREDYRTLLLSMLEHDLLEMTEEKELLVGLQGERLINSYKFYAVFQDSEDFTVRADADEIGTITDPPPVGDRFALAGRVWEVCDIDQPRRLVFVKLVEGKMEISWPGDGGEIHTRLLEKMREVLYGDKTYAYLMPNAAARLQTARALAHHTGMPDRLLLPLGGSSFVLFPWLGTRAFRTLRRLLLHHAARLGIRDIAGEGCCYITFKAQRADGEALLPRLRDILRTEGIDPLQLIGPAEQPACDKYDNYIPADLLRRAYATDRLSPEEVMLRLASDTPFPQETI